MTIEKLEAELSRLRKKKKLTRHDQLLVRRYADELSQHRLLKDVAKRRAKAESEPA